MIQLNTRAAFAKGAFQKSELNAAVILKAASLARWEAGLSPTGQSFFAHATCLVNNCKTSYPWEIGVILAEPNSE